MVANNKVLTVSYGVFSCTLEGFDDSFDTMKAIAEYFRDLAADDRYFGAVPPQPDADVLARIAEKELARQVSGELAGNSVVLRPAPAAVAVAETPPEEAASQDDRISQDTGLAENADSGDVLDGLHEDALMALPADAPDLSEQQRQKAEAEAKASKAKERAQQEADAKRKAQQNAKAKQEAEAKARAEKEAEEKAAAEAKAKADAKAKAEAQEREKAEALEKEAADARSKALAEEKAKIEAEASAKQEADAKAKALAEKRAKLEAEAEAEERAKIEAQEKAEADARAKALAEERAKIEAEAKAAALRDPDLDELAELSRDRQTEAEVTQTEASETGSITEKLARIRNVVDQDPIDAAPFTEDEHINDMTDLETGAVELDTDIAPKAAEPQKTITRPRVVKIKKSELDSLRAEIAGGAAAVAEKASLSPADLDGLDDLEGVSEDFDLEDLEAELAQELGAAEDAGAAGVDIIEDAPADAPDPKSQPRKALEDAPASVDLTENADLDRLMSETEAEMDDPEQRDRRENMGRARAAVAAAQDDLGLGQAGKADEKVFRDDLDASVADTPVPPTKTPLKLVAEQRVDLDENPYDMADDLDDEELGQVVQSATEQAIDEGMNFKQYLRLIESQDLGDLLEASAAYVSIVEGHEHFSRPQVLGRFLRVREGDYSREDGLREFGKMIRSGTLIREGNGRFRLDEDSQFGLNGKKAG